MPRRGFTIWQAILVVLLFLLLAGIMLPVFVRPRESWPRHTCQSNLKQITLGFKQYTQDYDEYFPRYNIGNVGNTSSAPFTATHWVQALQPYTKSLQIFQCQDERNSLGTDYYYSRVASGHRETMYGNSASSVLLTEGTDTAVGSFATATSPIKWGEPPAYSRHLEGSNYAFVDGHVKWLQSGRAATNEPAAKGGFTFNS